MPIPITKPVFGEAELKAVQRPIENGWVVQGPEVAEFERLFSKFTGAAHSVAASSGTTALHLAVKALGLQAGDEVVVPAFTWISTANVVEYEGARPVFVDIDLATFNSSPEAIAAAIGPRTTGLLPVHLFGLAAELDPILEAAKSHGLWVLEDAACALGTRYRGRAVGTLGEIGAFSFHPRKSITTGEGGMLTTQSDGIAAEMRSLRDHGAGRSDHDRHESANSFLLSEYARLGFNYRLTDIQAALGNAQMERLDWILARRRELAAAYDEGLAGLDWLRTPVVPEGHEHSYQAYVCLFAPKEPSPANITELRERRDRVMADLEAQGIATRQGTHSPVLQDFYRDRYGLRPEEFFNSWAADWLTIALPLYPQMTEEEQETVIAALRAVRP